MNTQQALIRSGVLLVLAVVTIGLCKAFPNAATDRQSGMDLLLPETLEGYVVREIEPDEKELYWLPPDTGILKRQYIAEGAKDRSDLIIATLILAGSDPRSLHRPAVCLDAQGFTIVDREVVALEVNGKKLEVMDFSLAISERLEDGTMVRHKAHYFYWWIGSNRSTPSDFKRIVYTKLDNMFRNVNSRWGYPSVMVWVDPALGADGDREAKERAHKFIVDHAAMFQKSLR